MVIGLISVHVVLHAIHYEIRSVPWLLIELFDVDREDSIPTRFSSTSMFIAAALAFEIWRDKHSVADKWRLYWFCVALGLGLMSLDEIAGFHESYDTVTMINWAVPG